MSRWLPVRALKRYLDAQGPNWATVIAWNAFFAFFPITIVVITVLGLLLRNDAIRSGIVDQVTAAFPGCAHGGCAVTEALDSFRDRAGLFGVIGVVGLLWGGQALFGAIEQGLCSLYPCKPRDFVQQKLMSFAMILVFCVLAVPLVLSGSLLSALQSLPAVPGQLRTGPAALIIHVGVGTLDATILFTAIYWAVPHKRLRLRHVLPGAIAAGVLFEGVTLLFPLYFSLSSRTAQWGQTFTFIFLLLFYFFILGQIVMLCGALNAELDPGPGAGQPVGLHAGGLTGEGVVVSGRLPPRGPEPRREAHLPAGH